MPESRLPTETAALVLPDSVQVVEFISDLHLSPELPRTVAAFESYLGSTTADAVFILGDLFDVWVGDDALQQPFEAACAQALKTCAERCRLYVMRGNRDFLLGAPFFSAIGAVDVPDPQAVQAFGQMVLLSHGDALCLADTEYQQFRQMVRSGAWQESFLARPLAERLQLAAHMRQASREHQSGGFITYADADPTLALQWLNAAAATTLVHGHTHRPGSEQFPEGWQRHVLSDWDMDHAMHGRAEVLRWACTGFSRHPLGFS